MLGADGILELPGERINQKKENKVWTSVTKSAAECRNSSKVMAGERFRVTYG